VPAQAQNNPKPNDRMENRMQQDTFAYPAPLDYPFAAPGTLHMEYWSDYTRSRREPGFTTDAWARASRLAEEQAIRDGAFATEDKSTVDPMSLPYPYAAPGGMVLSHWSDYTGSQLATGSATDARMDENRMVREQRMQEDRWRSEDPLNTDPMPASYPFAAPGSLDLYHWSDYTKMKMEAGSVANTRYEKLHKRLKNERTQEDQDDQNTLQPDNQNTMPK
jgi:hypothetical protein